ncbi:hypothetical protein HPB49_017764 [Dermacentor silvarum]|uniref:Uncharacterized protein n=1 Tax=Dermacentor silvarum TaxID=543639 RepID=A0ACB8DJW0_DERSI|nr:hypothetical protein HPB49_017764 [Dermacentor silvarum]
MLDHRVECGIVSRVAFKASQRERRLQSIQLSRHQDLEPFHVGYKKPWIVLADMRTGSSCQQLRGHMGSVLAVRWSPHTPGLLASGSRDGSVMLWDVRCARSSLATLQGHKGGTTAMTFLPDGMQLLTMGRDGRVKLWDVASQTMSRAHSGLACCKSPTQMSATQEVALLPSGHCLLVMDLVRKQPLRALSGAHFGQANCVLLCSDTLEAFSGANDRTILWWTSCGDRERALNAYQDGMPDSWSDEGEPF